MRPHISIGMIAVLCLAHAGSALADNFNPPPYAGVAPLSYHAEWDQFTDGSFSTRIYPDAVSSVDDSDPSTFLYNGLGIPPGTHLDFGPQGTWALIPASGGGFHNPSSPATFAANTVNWVDLLPLKELRVQVTYNDALGQGAPTITRVTGIEEEAPNGSLPEDSLPPGIPNIATPGQLVGHVDWSATQFSEDWIITPNPDWEQIEFFLPQGTIVEQIVIDSVSTVPVPGAVWLFGSGLIGLIGIARKRKAS